MFKNLFQKLYVGKNKDDLTVEDMPTNRFSLFGAALGVRLWPMVKMNLLFVFFISPLLFWTAYNIIVIMNVGLAALEAGEDLTNAIAQYVTVYLMGMIPCMALAGPPVAGLTYVTRNFARDEHAWLWSDFKDAMKANWKQSSAMMTLLGVVLLLFWMADSFYGAMAESSMIFGVLQYLMIVLVAIVLMSAIYTFPMMVTFDMKFGEILRTGMFMTVARLHFSVLFAALALLPFFLLLVLSAYWAFGLMVLVLYCLVWGFAFNGFLLNSYTNATFDRFTEKEEQERKAKEEVNPEDLID